MAADPPAALVDIDARLRSPSLGTVEAALVELAAWASAPARIGTSPIAALGLTGGDEDEDGDGDDGDDDDDSDDDDGDDDDDDDDELDEGDDDGMMHARAPRPLDAAIDRHLGALSPAVLARVFAALFQRTSDEVALAVVIATELATRGDDASQLAMIAAFVAARPTGRGSVEARLLTQVFPTLRAPALATLRASR